MAELSARQIHVALLRGDSVVSEETAFAAISAEFRFPTVVENWDALNDWLGDLSWLEGAAGYLLAIRDADEFFRNAPKVAATLIEFCGYAADFWQRQGRPFHLLLLF